MARRAVICHCVGIVGELDRQRQRRQRYRARRIGRPQAAALQRFDQVGRDLLDAEEDERQIVVAGDDRIAQRILADGHTAKRIAMGSKAKAD